MKALVTGATGFAGRHLCRRLLEAGHEVVGTALSDEEAQGAPHPVVRCDITDAAAVDALFRQTRPDAVFHLAAVTSVREATHDPEAALGTNVEGTRHLLESTFRNAAGATFVAISSGEVYGRVRLEDLPIRESQPVAPVHLYGETKAAVERLCQDYAQRLRIIVLRPFNHIGPGQSPRFVVSSFAKQVADIEAGRAEPVLRVGNLAAERDFSHVRDVVEAYLLAVARCEPATPYNVCSGVAVPIRRVLDLLLSMSRVRVRVEQDPDRLRPSDIPVLCGCPEKLERATGWTRRYRLEQTLADVLAAWRQRAK